MAYNEYFKTCKGNETVENLIEDINNWLKVRWPAAWSRGCAPCPPASAPEQGTISGIHTRACR